MNRYRWSFCRYVTLLFFVLGISQLFAQPAYGPVWKQIEELGDKGQYRSAREKLKELIARSTRDNQPAQLVKATYGLFLLDTYYGEEGLEGALPQLAKAAEEAAFPARPLLLSLLGQYYHAYMADNFYRLAEQTLLSAAPSTDIASWTLADLSGAVLQAYEASLEDARIWDIPLETFAAVVDIPEDTRVGFPTLGDFLSFMAIRHFSDERTYLTEPAYAFVLDGSAAFAPVADFVGYAFPDRDSLSYKRQATILYQQYLGRLLDNASALHRVSVDLMRLSFAYENTVSDQKEEQYEEVLRDLFKQHQGTPASAPVAARLALFYQRKGQAYAASPIPAIEALQSDAKNAMKEALRWCGYVLSQYPDSFAAARCRALQQQITHPMLRLEAERVYLPDVHALLKVTYRNVSELDLVILNTPHEFRGSTLEVPIRRHLEKGKYSVRQRQTIALPVTEDHQDHTAEIALDPLPFGHYTLVAIQSGSDSVYATISFSVSGLGLVEGDGYDVFRETFIVVDRASGDPVEGAKLILSHKDTFVGEWLSDVQGTIRLPGYLQSNYYTLTLEKGADRRWVGQQYLSIKGDEPDYERPDPGYEIHLFLDRAIYRPGQQLYFKALILDHTRPSQPAIITQREITMELVDPNGQVQAKKTFLTGGFGTFHGFFDLPESGLLGTYFLRTEGTWWGEYFRVEAYKRPSYEITFEGMDTGYQLGDSVQVTSVARAYAGQPIGNAQVVYQVRRRPAYVFRPWWLDRYFSRYASAAMQWIASGTGTTDASGKFVVPFAAIAPSPGNGYLPDAYDFEVVVTVTDISGETHTATKNLRVGRSAIEVSLDVEKDQVTGTPIPLSFAIRNLDGKAMKADVELEIHRLDAPERNTVDRLWELPDQELYPQDTFHRLFPHFTWGWEAFPQLFPLREKIFAQRIPATAGSVLSLDAGNWEPGRYKIFLHLKLPDGDTLTTEAYFNLSDPASGKIIADAPVLTPGVEGTFQPGDTVRLTAYAREHSQRLYYSISNIDSLWLSGWQTAQPEYRFTHTVGDSDRGNIVAEGFYMRHNRVFSFRQEVRVPWTNKQLSIGWKSFRDKMEPGEREKWQISIRDAGGEPLDAELMATLYDASLDVFDPHDWQLSLYPHAEGRGLSNLRFDFNRLSWISDTQFPVPAAVPDPSYPGYSSIPGIPTWYNYGRYMSKAVPMMAMAMRDEVEVAEKSMQLVDAEEETQSYSVTGEEMRPEPYPGDIPLRENLRELVFFEPALRTDSTGTIIYEFVVNEALTRWKLLALAHTRDLKYGLTTRTIITQKPLMVEPFAPRFLRAGDQMMMGAKISNLQPDTLKGTAGLALVHALTGESLESSFGLQQPTQAFVCPPGASIWVEWQLEVPDNPELVLQYDIVAQAGDFSDGERNQLPVLSNRALVTESAPVFLRPGQQKELKGERLSLLQESPTFRLHRFSLEATPNPVWYAIQSLPYLNAYPFDCTEQLFNKLFAQRIGQGILQANPDISAGIKARAEEGTAVMSPLQRNTDLKMNLLAETPWVWDAGGESQVAADLVKFLDVQETEANMEELFARIAERQLESGAFPWFPGGPESWYITQYLIEGFVRLDNMGLLKGLDKASVDKLLRKAIIYMDQSADAYLVALQTRAKKERSGYLRQDHLNPLLIHYLFVRCQVDAWVPGKRGAAYQFFLAQAGRYWSKKGIYEMGLLAWTMQVERKEKTVAEIMQTLREQSFRSEEGGMYWKNPGGWFWYQDPVETQAFLIGLFAETGAPSDELDDLRLWLLNNKRVRQWHSTRATAAAVYALLSEGSDWVRPTGSVVPSFPDAAPEDYRGQIDSALADAEAGTGYFRADWQETEFRPALSHINWQNEGQSPAWGAVYWQYFENYDRITATTGGAMQISKSLYRIAVSDAGPSGEPLSPESAELKPGDRLLVRLTISNDRDMEYLHLKDTRAAGLEPAEALSGYEWSQGLGYYRQVRDTATDFFIEYLPRGKHVFEYELVVMHKGEFSGGLTTLQSMYAPEFIAHTEGIRLSVK